MATKKAGVDMHTTQHGLWGDCVHVNGNKYEIDDKGNLCVDNADDAKKLASLAGFKVGSRVADRAPQRQAVTADSLPTASKKPKEGKKTEPAKEAKPRIIDRMMGRGESAKEG